MIYLIKDVKRDGTLFKIGFTTCLPKRLIPYATHNPMAQLLETIQTRKSTKHKLESQIHEELKEKGYNFIVSSNGILTEWFFVEKEKEKEFEEKGLAQFKACKNRKIYKAKN